jgi:acetoin utilization protein AcuB
MFIDKSMTTGVVTLDPDALVLKAKDLMEQHNIRHIPVVDPERFLIGIVSDRDIRSAMPPLSMSEQDYVRAQKTFVSLKVKDIMTKNVLTISAFDTLQDALLIMQKTNVGAFPVVDLDGRLVGILSVRDVLRAFTRVLGIEEPGTLLGIVVENKPGQTKIIVDAITEEGIPFGSILVARHWEKDKRAVFPYLLSTNVVRVKKKLEKMGFKLLNPMDWSIDKHPQ